METIRKTKAELRRSLRAEAQRHTEEERVAASAAIREQLVRQAPWQTARAILFYAAMTGEVDLWPLLKDALAAGKQVALPSYEASTDQYFACQIVDFHRDLCRGHVGIIEPVSSCARFPLNKLDLVLVPGLGFTADGRRLGRGKGYYDRILSAVRGWKCGVAFDWQIAAEIPTEGHDIIMDCIITPTRWHSVVRPRWS